MGGGGNSILQVLDKFFYTLRGKNGPAVIISFGLETGYLCQRLDDPTILHIYGNIIVLLEKEELLFCFLGLES